MADRPISLRQVVAYLVKYLAVKRIDKDLGFPGTPAVVHSAFFDLQRRFGDDLPQLKRMHFITLGQYPYSHELTEVLDSLQFSGAFTRDNPSYATFRPGVTDDTIEWLGKMESLIGDTTRPKLRAAADALGERLFSS